MYYYKNGGTRDFGLYAKAGNAFINKENAYITQSWRSGSFGSVSIWLLSVGIPESIKVGFLQILSFSGFWFFGSYFFKEKQKSLWMMGFVLFLSPVREVINTLQITGLVVGLLTVFLIHNEPDNWLWKKIFGIAQTVSLAIAVDLKPHSLAFIVFLLFLKDYKRRELISSAIVLITCHAFIDIWNGRILERDWIAGLLNLGNASGQSGESTSIWKLIDYVTHSKIDTSTLSLISVFLILGLASFSIRNLDIEEIIIVGLLASSLMTYMHYYDLAPLAIICLAFILELNLSVLGTSLIMFLILPREITQSLNIVTLFALVFIVIVLKSEIFQGRDKLRALIRLIISILVFLSLHLINASMNLDYRMTHALMTTETMILIWTYLSAISRKNLKIDLKQISRKRK